MHLTVKQKDLIVNQNHIIKGPIYIGRHSQSQIFLPNQSVSRQHAVVFLTDKGQWMIKDLQSANKSYTQVCKYLWFND
jgi:pSer/pThr/pTyr-binding forkhead associated (FHA) protein